ncbi:winged helix-turn-helix transcriptional regulator [Novosphingobium colocasiae]|uniref:Transcriptional regulator n=1 Tax=Novosphingobium colocasiae TaxID=1256513 RepID=A0A918UJ02_9SPHN|nr:winged helix-turn-helix transcriptional regulator [Novosphingobium colocasiae]GGZ13710.1 transcriptional regulator [Novosphingobium colocasiae]
MGRADTSPAGKRGEVHGRWYADGCGAAFAMELIGERWTLLIVREMMLGGRRFTELRAALPGLSAKTLTERLGSLQALGIVEKRHLPPPASAQVYALTEWGRGLEPVMQELGRWAVRSPLHDPQLTMTPVALLLSMRTMLAAERVGDLGLWIGFEIAGQHFAGRLAHGELSVHPGGERLAAPDLRFTAPDARDFLPVFYGKKAPEECGSRLTIEGDPRLAARFLALFELPAKLTG